jgi:hypothetical protein
LVCSRLRATSCVRGVFDVGPFFTRLAPLAVAERLVRHPLDPLPHMRARRASPRPATRVPTVDGACVAGWRAWHESDF